MDNEFLTNIWGWFAGIGVFAFDHWSGIAAFILFGMQAVYQVYRIRIAKRRDKREAHHDWNGSTSDKPEQD